MRMAVEDEVRAVLPDRAGKPLGAEDEPEAFGLTLERVRRRRVVQERDAQSATGDGAKPALERLDVSGRLRVRLAEERLAEVGPAVVEAADETLHGGDADADTLD